MPLTSLAAARRATATLAAALALTSLASPAAAQLAAPRRAPEPTRQTASVNLLGVPFGFVSGEYERALGTEGLAFGLGGTVSFDDTDVNVSFNDNSDEDRFASLQAKLKYYPAARGLRGFAVGVTAGVASVRGTTSRFVGTVPVTTPGGVFPEPRFERTRFTDTRPTVGTVLDYNFLLGARQRFLVGLGLGARRVLGSRPAATNTGMFDSGYRPGLDQTLFDGRLQIGFGF